MICKRLPHQNTSLSWHLQILALCDFIFVELNSEAFLRIEISQKSLYHLFTFRPGISAKVPSSSYSWLRKAPDSLLIMAANKGKDDGKLDTEAVDKYKVRLS